VAPVPPLEDGEKNVVRYSSMLAKLSTCGKLVWFKFFKKSMILITTLKDGAE